MFDQKHKNTENQSFTQEMLNLNDEFTEFHDQCSFLCDAYSILAMENEHFDPHSAQGQGLTANWMKYKVREFQLRIQRLQEKSRNTVTSNIEFEIPSKEGKLLKIDFAENDEEKIVDEHELYDVYQKMEANRNEKSECNNVVERDIIEYFNTGALYIPQTSPTFIFDAFEINGWLASALEHIKEYPMYVNPDKAWNEYDLLLSLGLPKGVMFETYPIDQNLWAVKTCFGYWLSDEGFELIKDEIDKQRETNKLLLTKILSSVTIRGTESLVHDYREYLDDITRLLRKYNLHYKFEMGELVKNYERYVKRIVRQLSDLEQLIRLSAPLTCAGMPYIWSDKPASNAFLNSFYKSLISSNSVAPYLSDKICDYLNISKVDCGNV